MSATPCTSGPRHKWEWVKNVKIGKFKVTTRGTSGTISLRGLYKCQCGSSKHGLFNPNGSDLRGTTQGAKLVTKPDSRPQNCGSNHCSCIECPYHKTDWSAA